MVEPTTQDEAAVGREDLSRWLSVGIGGALAAVGLRRISLANAVVAGIGGYLIYRGLRGAFAAAPEKEALARRRRVGGEPRRAERPRRPAEEAEARERDRSRRDAVEQASWESFPASDSPAW